MTRYRLPLAAFGSLAVAFALVWLYHGNALGRTSPGAGRGVWFMDAAAYYLPAFRAVWSGAPAPQGWYYPPFFAVVGAPLGLLPPRAFLLAWGALQAGAFLLVALVVGRELERTAGERWALLFVALLGISDGVVHTLLWGQVSVLLVGMVAAAFALDARGRTVAGAAVLGAAIAIKIYPAAAVVYWLARREWRTAGLAVAFAAGFTMLPWLVIGPERAGAMLASAFAGLGSLDARSPELLLSQGWVSVLARLWAFTGLYAPFATELWLPLMLVYGAVAAWLFAGLALRGAWLPASALLWCGLPFLPGAIWPHYLAFLPLVQATAFVRAQESPHRTALVALAAVSAVVASAPAALLVHPAIHPALGVPFFASVLAGGALVAGVFAVQGVELAPTPLSTTSAPSP